jgi:hypothetical protein
MRETAVITVPHARAEPAGRLGRHGGGSVSFCTCCLHNHLENVIMYILFIIKLRLTYPNICTPKEINK